jgi:hypothetical protein
VADLASLRADNVTYEAASYTGVLRDESRQRPPDFKPIYLY